MFQLNVYYFLLSFLKIHHVEDLPDKYKWKSRQNHPITGPDSSAPHHMTVREDSAATPPDYKYKEARLIPLDESMQLQQAQQKHQEASVKYTCTSI